MVAAKIGTSVSLDNIDQMICKGIARQRYNNARKAGVENRKVGDQSNEETDLQGFGAEYAFCKINNLCPDFTIHPRSMYDDIGDAQLPDGRYVDVKATKYTNGRLVAVKWKKPDQGAELYALMIGTFPNYEFRGFMHREDLLRSERLGNLGHGEHFLAPQSDLKELFEIIK